MKRILVLFMMCLAACSSSASPSGGGAGGDTGGSTVTTTTSDGGTAGAGGTTEAPVVEFGPPADCTGHPTIMPIHAAKDQALTDIPLVDDTGAPIEEDGALACRRFVPPSVPFVFSEVDAYWGNLLPCSITPNVVTFVAPKDAAWPIVADYMTDGNDLQDHALPIGSVSGATVQIGSKVESATDAFYACAKLAIDGDSRACVSGCKLPAGKTDPDSFWSKTTNGAVDPLPTIDLQVMAHSPTDAIAQALDTPRYGIKIVARGHAL